jgi:predicted nucleic acid-binding protein
VKPGPVFCDTGIFIAFLDRSDRHHQIAARLFADPPRRWFSSLTVVSETYGWFLHRLGEDAADAFRLALAEFPRLRLLPIDDGHHGSVVRRLDRLRGHRLTYVDASSLVFLERLKIAEVWGTDFDLAVEGARVIPGGAE